MKVEIGNKNLSPSKKFQNAVYNPSFKGPLDGLITQSLMTIDTNPMVNAALVDVFAMVVPRTYVDTKERNKYAGAETLIREAMGTFCVCLSSGIMAKGISRLYNNFVDSKTKINPDIWATKAGLELLKHSWDNSKNAEGHSVEKYVSNVLTNVSGLDGRKNVNWKDIDWKNVQWIDNPKWENFDWKDANHHGIQDSLKGEEGIIKTFSRIIEDKTIDKKDAKKIQEILSYRITNALGVGNSVNVEFDKKKINSSMNNIIRDTYDLGKDIFTNKLVDTDAALTKLTKMSKVKTLGALAVSSFLALITQYVNRQITKKRTGSDAFVGDTNYGKSEGNKESKKESKAKLWGLKALTSAGMIGMSAFVMKIKSPADFVKKLEFTGAVTSGNAMKTIYAAQLVGRFLASKNDTELRESATRDYLGFLNWLVFGGFVSKGVGQLLFDKKLNNLFNVSGETNSVGKWLNNFTPKSHAEVAAKGAEFAKKNIWKVNVIQASGLIYSVVALGILLPLLNIVITNRKQKKTTAQV